MTTFFRSRVGRFTQVWLYSPNSNSPKYLSWYFANFASIWWVWQVFVFIADVWISHCFLFTLPILMLISNVIWIADIWILPTLVSLADPKCAERQEMLWLAGLVKLTKLAKPFMEYLSNFEHAQKWNFMWLSKLVTFAKSLFWEKCDSPCQIHASDVQVCQMLREWPLLNVITVLRHSKRKVFEKLEYLYFYLLRVLF